MLECSKEAIAKYSDLYHDVWARYSSNEDQKFSVNLHFIRSVVVWVKRACHNAEHDRVIFSEPYLSADEITKKLNLSKNEHRE